MIDEQIEAQIQQDVLEFQNQTLAEYRYDDTNLQIIELQVRSFAMNGIITQLEKCFNLQHAVGKQLDILGSVYQANRNVLDIDNIPQVLNDTQFQTVIRFAQIKSILRHSEKEIDDLLWANFGNKLSAICEEFKIVYILNVDLLDDDDIILALMQQDLLPRPLGMRRIQVLQTDSTGTYLGFQDWFYTNARLGGFMDWDDDDVGSALLDWNNIYSN